MSANSQTRKHFTYKEQVSRSITWGHYFIFINILLSCLLGYGYVYAAPPTSDFLSFIYLHVSWLGHMSFLTVVAYLVLFFPLAFIGNYRLYRVFAVAIASILHSILLFDLKIFLMVKVHLSVTALNLIVRELDFDTGLNYNFLFIAVPLVIALECVFAKVTTHSLYREHHPYFVRTVLIIVGSCFISSHLLHIWADATHYERITLLRSTFPVHYPMTAQSFLNNHGWFSDSATTPTNLTAYLDYPLSPITVEESHPALNVITINVNAWSYQNLNAEQTPQLMALATQGYNFEQNYLLYEDELSNSFSANFGLPIKYSQAFYSTNTLPVMVSEMLRQDYVRRLIVSDISLQPLMAETGTQHDEAASSEAEIKPTVSAGATVNEENKDPAAARARAYLHQLVLSTALRRNQLDLTLTAPQALAQALTEVRFFHDQAQRPFALTVVINDLRQANALSKLRLEQALKQAKDELKAQHQDLSESELDTLAQAQVLKTLSLSENSLMAQTDMQVREQLNYERTLSEVDAAIGQFVAQLKQEGVLDNTVLIITANEGNRALPSLGLHYERAQQHVPLLVFFPQRAAAQGTSSALTSSQDIYATIAREVLTITSPLGNFTLGDTLRSLRQREYLVADQEDALILVEPRDNIIFVQDGASFIERDGVRLEVRPELESLIEATRDLNRFVQ